MDALLQRYPPDGSGGRAPEVLCDLLEFAFPPGVQHPRSGPRIFVFALFGPPVRHPQTGALTVAGGGVAGGSKRALSAGELVPMLDEVEQEFLVALHLRADEEPGKLRERWDAILEQVGSLSRDTLKFTPEQLVSLAGHCASFPELQE